MTQTRRSVAVRHVSPRSWRPTNKRVSMTGRVEDGASPHPDDIRCSRRDLRPYPATIVKMSETMATLSSTSIAPTKVV